MGSWTRDLGDLRGDLSRLEEQKVNALMLSGIGYMEEEKRGKSSRLFSFFQDLSPLNSDVDASPWTGPAPSPPRWIPPWPSWARKAARVEGLPTSYPVSPDAIVTREFGYSPDPFTGRKALHAGVDFSMRAGAPVHAAGAGVVVEAGKDLLWGWFVRIDHGREVHSFYAHLEKVLVARGQAVDRGETMGLMGMTGVATGVHLHYELTIRGAKSDPDALLPARTGAGLPAPERRRRTRDAREAHDRHRTRTSSRALHRTSAGACTGSPELSGQEWKTRDLVVAELRGRRPRAPHLPGFRGGDGPLPGPAGARRLAGPLRGAARRHGRPAAGGDAGPSLGLGPCGRHARLRP